MKNCLCEGNDIAGMKIRKNRYGNYKLQFGDYECPDSNFGEFKLIYTNPKIINYCPICGKRLF